MEKLQEAVQSASAFEHWKEVSKKRAPENYERYFVPVIGAPLASDMIEYAGIGSGERVLDVACGTGTATRLAAERVGATGTVVGVDINPGMLAVARVLPSAPGVEIEWHEAPADALPFENGSFDVVLCQLSLQFFPDRLEALREMRRVLAPGGRAVVCVPAGITPLFSAMAEALRRHIGPQAAGFVHQVFALTSDDEVRSLLVGAGFSDVRAHTYPRELRLPPAEEFLWQYVGGTPLAGAVAHATDEARAAVERDVVEAWQAFVDDGTVLYRQDVVLATGS